MFKYVFTSDNFGQLGRKYVKLRHQLTYPNLSDIINLRVFVTGRHLDQVTKTNISFISQQGKQCFQRWNWCARFKVQGCQVVKFDSLGLGTC